MNFLNKTRTVAAKISAVFLAMFFLPIPTVQAINKRDKINNRELELNWDKPVIAYGDGLDDEQREETFRLLGVTNKSDYQFVEVNEVDVMPFSSALFITNVSSVAIQKTPKGSGVHVYINTPDNITQIEDYEYSNAAITSGVEDCNIVVAAAIEASGSTALAGVFKVFDLIDEGSIDRDAARVSAKELSVLAGVKKELGIIENSTSGFKEGTPKLSETEKTELSKRLSTAILQIKQKVAEKKIQNNGGALTEEELQADTKAIMTANQIEVSDLSIKKLVDWLGTFQELSIDWPEISRKLVDFSNKNLIEKSGQTHLVKPGGISWLLILVIGIAVLALIGILIWRFRGKNR